MAYAEDSDVAALCRNLIAGAETFTASTSPTLAQVDAWLSSGCAAIESDLMGLGYSVPPASTTRIYAQLGDLNALFAAARAELSRTNIRIGPGERTRGQLFDEMFWNGLERLESLGRGDLSAAGLSRSAAGTFYAGGISIDEKTTEEERTDRVAPRFSRGQFAFPGTLRPQEAPTAS